ncbi:MAG: hypothetical protein FJZ63_07325 [Chlamydiae bacterium]|nr:hypothetical protein [Chlamydiota bacterium]
MVSKADFGKAFLSQSLEVQAITDEASFEKEFPTLQQEFFAQLAVYWGYERHPEQIQSDWLKDVFASRLKKHIKEAVIVSMLKMDFKD